MPETRPSYTTANEWDNILNRLEMAAQKASGLCAITISVLIVDGVPISWTAPEVTPPMEPKRCAAALLRFLTMGPAVIIASDGEGRPIQEE